MHAPLRVLFTFSLAGRLGGSETFLYTFLSNVDRRRIEPIVAFFADGVLVEDVTALGISTIVLPTGRVRNVREYLRVVRTLSRYLRRHEVDVVVSWDAKPHLYGAPAAVLAGIGDRTMWMRHADMDPRWPGLMSWVATLMPAVLIAAPSRFVAAQQHRVWPHRPTIVVHPGLDPSSAQVPQDVSSLRQTLGIPDDRRVVGTVGRLVPWKGQDRLIAAAELLAAAGHDAHTLIVGGTVAGQDPAYEHGLRRAAESAALRGRVSFAGQVRDASPYLELMDVFVNTSQHEPFGIVVLEAMAASVPVVASREGGTAEILRDGETGRLVDVSDPAAIAEALGQMLQEPEHAAGLAAQALDDLNDRFTVRRMTTVLTEAIEGIAPR